MIDRNIEVFFFGKLDFDGWELANFTAKFSTRLDFYAPLNVVAHRERGFEVFGAAFFFGHQFFDVHSDDDFIGFLQQDLRENRVHFLRWSRG